MRINLAKIVPPAFYLLIVLVVFAISSGSGGHDSPEPPSFEPEAGATAAADRYLDDVAAELASPGLYVDPDVLADGDLTASEVDDLDDAADDQAGPVRIAVLPAGKLLQDDEEATYASKYDLAYDQEEMVAQLYDRVGADGTYAILVDAASESAGRSFFAVQFAEDGPTYDVEGAANDALACCAPDYADILDSFIDDAGDEKVGAGTWFLRIGGTLAGLGALLFGGRRLRRWRGEREADQKVTEVLRTPLDEEVIELSARVSTLPPAEPDTEVSTHTLATLDLVEQARQRLDRMRTAADAEAVTSRLADARWHLVVIDALRAGRPAPERTAPCFFDPRHGPSVEEHAFTPEDGEERPVPVCTACRDELAAGRPPAVRTISKDGKDRFYWDLGTASRPYLDGYWQRRRHPEARAEQNRRPVPVAARPGQGFTFVWESDAGSGSGSGSGGWGGSGRSSGRTRSFGGGRSSRSSSRSRGGGGF